MVAVLPALDVRFANMRILQSAVPNTRVLLYRDEDGSVPFLEWFATLPARAKDRCRIRMERLSQLGHELRRPEADYLRNGIYELRASVSGLHYRILYFFYGKAAVVISHGLMKQREVPAREIERAIRCKARFEGDVVKHTHAEE